MAWRITLHRRDFGSFARPSDTGIAELTTARSRRLELAANDAAKLTFTVDGRSPAAAYVQELTTEAIAWRWDPALGRDVQMFRGIVVASDDAVSETAHSVNFTAMDYLQILRGRFLTSPADLVYTQQDQDAIVRDLVSRGSNVTSGNGATSFSPGSRIPLAVYAANPDGTQRTADSGTKRDRTYTGQTSIGEAITNLAAVDGGFDVDVWPASDTWGTDYLRVWFPSRGVARTDVALAYGSTVSAFTRNVSVSDYANYVRVIGDSGGAATQLYADRWNTDANNVGVTPVGLWMAGYNESDVNQQATLNEKAQGDLNVSGVLVPSYTLTLRPGWFRPGYPNIGDTVPLVLASGRLQVSTTVRVLGINYAPLDDGDGEDVEIVVGRPPLTLDALFRRSRRDINALARR